MAFRSLWWCFNWFYCVFLGSPNFFSHSFYITWSNTYWALAVIPIVLILIRIQPEPADDCPCFEDSVAFLGVLMGQYLGEWQLRYQCYRVDNLLQTTDRASLGAIDKIYLKAREKYILEWELLNKKNLLLEPCYFDSSWVAF